MKFIGADNRMLVLKNATLLDVVAGTSTPACMLVAEQGRITHLDQSTKTAPPTAEVIDCRGRTVMPGLIDAHIHAYAAEVNLLSNDQQPKSLLSHHASSRLTRMLARGFTTVRDCGGGDAGLAMAIDQRLFPSPRFYHCGKLISQTGGHGDFRQVGHAHGEHHSCVSCGCGYSGHLSIAVDGVDEVRRAVRNNLRKGASFIKFAASGGVSSTTSPLEAIQFSDEEVRAIIDEVERFGTYCTAHIHPDQAIRRAIELGVHCVEHGSMMSRETAELAASRRTAVVPTLAIVESLLREGHLLGIAEVSRKKLGRVSEQMLESLKHMRDAGVHIGFGTDLLGRLDRHQYLEFELRAQVFSPVELIQQATVNNAKLMGLSGLIGELRVGALADMLIVDIDPTQDSAAISQLSDHLELVVQNGALSPL